VFPCKVFEAGVAAAVQAGAKVDETFWFFDQAGENIGGEGVDRKDGGKAIDRGYAMPFAGADGGVVNDCIEWAKLVCAGGDGFGFGDAAQVAGDGVFGAGGGGEGFFSTLGIAGVENNDVALGNQKLGGHFAEAVGGAGDEDF